MKDKTAFAKIIIRVLGFAFLGLAILFTASQIMGLSPVSPESDSWGRLAEYCLLYFIGAECAAYGLRQKKPWGWMLALFFFSVLLFHPVFLPFSLLGLYGLFNQQTRRDFGISRAPQKTMASPVALSKVKMRRGGTES